MNFEFIKRILSKWWLLNQSFWLEALELGFGCYLVSLYPKQFAKFVSDKTLFQEAALRLVSSSIVNFLSHITITNSDFRFIVGEQLQEVGIDPGTILIEPSAKNTAPAVLAASIHALKEDSNAIVVVAPSDHLIKDVVEFHKAILIGIEAIEQGNLVTFGVEPSQAETGYGYLN